MLALMKTKIQVEMPTNCLTMITPMKKPILKTTGRADREISILYGI